MNRIFGWIVVIVSIAVVTGLGWLVYGRFNASEAAEFDESISMVNHQTVQMSQSLDVTDDFVNERISEITSISTLLTEWTPRFNAAQTAYTKFDAAIASAEKRAEIYFATQRALTERYNNPELRAEAKARDDEDFELYTQWQYQAHSVLAEALRIVQRLEDVDTDLQKIKLVSEFSFDANRFSTVPSDILNLERELTQFQIASENIREITASPFERTK